MGNFTPSIDYVSVKTGGVTLFEQILAFLDGRMDTPSLYGWYHILCLVLTIGACVLVFLKARNLSDGQMNLLMRVTSITLIVLEIYKQLNFSYSPSTDTWSYQWYAFPFQFCASPMYVMLVVSFVKNQKVRDSLFAFMATYGLFAGTAVMFYPGDVFTGTIGINIHTMIHHGTMVVVGVLMYVSGRAKFSHKTILTALPVFCVFVGLALLFNILYGMFGDLNQAFNMFFISPYFPCTLPVLSMFYGKVPYLVFLMLYIVGFSIAGYVMSLLAMGINKLHILVREKLLPKKEENSSAETAV